jgi:soluble lytic murein transglycosylase
MALPSSAEFSRGENYQPTSSVRFEQRKAYRQAIHLITSGQRSRYLKMKDALVDYPLFPYLDYTDRIYRISRQKPDSVSTFLTQNANTPLANQLLQNYLYSLGKRGQWDTFVDLFEPGMATRRNACYHAYALSKTGRIDQAMDEAKKLWLVDHSQPDECDPIFKLWREAGHLTAENAWRRYALSLEADEVTLAKYLQRFLAEQDRKLAADFRLVHIKPRNLSQLDRFSAQNAKTRELVLHGIRRLARRDADAAFDLLKQYETRHSFQPDMLEQTYVYVARRMTGSDSANPRLDQMPINTRDHPELVSAIIRQALRMMDWSQVLVLIHVLPDEVRETPRWQYWNARVLADSADNADQQTATVMFRNIAGLRNFYGFLASDALKQPYNFVENSADVTDKEFNGVENLPGVQRALELFTLGELTRARREWYFITERLSNRQKTIAARVAIKWGWYKPAIQSLIDAEAWDDLPHRFPVAYYESFIRHARQADIPVNWSLAIARQESAFMPDAKSPSGALGLMQLMPATARVTAQFAGLNYKSSKELTNPALNINLGSQYLGQMLRRYDNNRILASAAYNAGPGRVDRWRNDQLAFDVWIETIPFTETRNYVQNVLMFAAIYGKHLNLAQPLIYPHEYAEFAATPLTQQPSNLTHSGS